MNEPIYLTQQTRENLIQHLVNFEENQDEVINDYFPHLNQERLDFTEKVNQYKKSLEELLQHVEIAAKDSDSFPLVIIGSKVTIRDLDNQETYVYCISDPSLDSFCFSDVSYISPVGKALLLKKVGDRVTVNTPAGQFKYEILNIYYGENITQK